DDTVCATAALIGMGQRPSLSFYRLLWENEAAPGGPYFTWLGVHGAGGHLLARQVDALVQANVLLCAGMAGMELPGTLTYLLDVVAHGNLEMASDYCITPHLLIYAIARAYADGPVPGLAPAVPALCAAMQALPVSSTFELACKTAALAAFGAPDGAHLTALLEAQLPDGSWPIAPAYWDYPPYINGSPSLTTAIALDAIAAGLRGSHDHV
ncbi:MAG: hypothetical protein HGA19_24945, partial [Oscillochloris sp.]|nr:hypothetical protein [Oscillochloris sp.]